MRMLLRYLAFSLIIIGLAGCGGLPNEVEDRASTIKQSIGSLDKMLEDERTALLAIPTKDAGLWKFLEPYATRENWTGSLDKVKQNIAGLQETFNSQVQPLLDANKEESEATLTALLEAIEKNFDPVKVSIRSVKDRIALLQTAKDHATAWIEQSRTHVTQLDTSTANLKPLITEIKGAFPDRSSDIDMRLAPLSKLVTDAHDALVRAEGEFTSHAQGKEANYALFADTVTFIASSSAQYIALDAEYRADLNSLYEDHTVILRDMKIEYKVQIVRTSWDENSDWNTENDHVFDPVFISKDDFEYLSSLSEGDSKGQQEYLADYYSSWGSWSTKVHIDKSVWQKLSIDEGASMPYGNNSSQFSIAELEPVYYHKYAKVTGTTVAEGDWEEVDEEEFAQHVESFGMAIETKPLGRFADEAVEEPTPVGIEMVGNERYGEWKQDSTGNSFWHYYGQYAFINALIGGNNHSYSRNEYDNYRTWRSGRNKDTEGTAYGWYGSNSKAPTYGSSGSQTTKTASYTSSPFAKGGGARSVSPNLRDAGVTARSRGPGARGK